MNKKNLKRVAKIYAASIVRNSAMANIGLYSYTISDQEQKVIFDEVMSYVDKMAGNENINFGNIDDIYNHISNTDRTKKS